MSLHRMLLARAADGNPLRIGVIGAGKFGSMYLSQIPTTPGIHLLGIADLSPPRARENLARLGWKPEVTAAGSLAEARRHGNTHLSDDWRALVSHPEIDIIVESTGDPIAAVEHALAAFEHGKSVVMVTVEADAFCGPLLARRAAAAGVIYSLAYGDQPALICELVDWARTSGFEVTAAGRGHKWLPHYAQSTPETVWKYWGLNEEQAKRGGLNPKMFNSFLDGSKPAIESTAVANATGLTPAPDGLAFPPCAVEDLPFVMRPASEGGHLHHKGQVECASSLERDGRAIPYEIRKGVWVVFEAATDYQKNCFEEYMLCTDPSGRYSVMYKRWHLIGLEVGMSVASIGLRKEPTGCADRLPCRRDRHRQARPESRRDAGRRGRLHRVRQAVPGREVDRAGQPAAGARPQRKASEADQGRPVADLCRRGDGREPDRGEAPPRDGAGLRAGRNQDRGAIAVIGKGRPITSRRFPERPRRLTDR